MSFYFSRRRKKRLQRLALNSVQAPVATVDPSIDNLTPNVGDELTGDDGTWTDADSFARQWKRSGAAISGATDTTYTVVDADFGHTLTYAVTATGAGGETEAESAATGTVVKTPAQLFGSNLKFWRDVSATLYQDAAGTTNAGDGDPVGRAPDISGNGNHDTSTGTARPTLDSDGLNGTPVLVFGGNDYLANDALAALVAGDDVPYTLCVVAKLDGGGTANMIVGIGSSSSNTPLINMFNNSTTNWLSRRRDDSNAVTAFTAGGTFDTEWHIHTYVFTGSAIVWRVDGVQIINLAANVGTISADRFTWGALRQASTTLFLTGAQGEAVFADVAADEDQVAAIEAYMQAVTGLNFS